MRELIAGKAALIVIDMQKGGLDPFEISGISHMAGYQERINRVVTVVEACHGAGIPVIFFQEIHRRDLVDFGRELDGAEGVFALIELEATSQASVPILLANSQHLRVQIRVSVPVPGNGHRKADQFFAVKRSNDLSPDFVRDYKQAYRDEISGREVPDFFLQRDASAEVV